MKLLWVECCIAFGIVSCCYGVTCFDGTAEKETDYLMMRLDQFNREFQRMRWLYQSAEWSYSTNVTAETAEARSFSSELYSDWMRKWKSWARGIPQDHLTSTVTDTLDMIGSGIVIKNAEDASKITDLRSKMTQIYSSTTISIPSINAVARGEEEFGSLMGKSRDPVILETIWRSWRQQVGKTKPFFLNLLDLLNKAAQENGYENLGSFWRRELGSQDVLDVALSLWKDVKFFYSQLHAYTRHKLKSVYGLKFFGDDSPVIPAHLLGSLWAENWASLNDILAPYPEKFGLNLTSRFISANYTVLDLAHKAEEFYISAGLNPMEQSFWRSSMFENPKDGRLVDCHPASYDLALNRDFRIKMCGEVKEQSFIEIIHEMGHIQYSMAYHHLPMLFRNGANSAFHEAVGETMVYTVQSPECLDLMKIGKSPTISNDVLINTLMKQALSKFVFLPWALTVEVWRYMLLSGNITEENMNEEWWNFRKKIQGIEPPNDESSKYFDAGTKYHIINSISYMRYFISRFLEHQFLKSLCSIAGENLHSCCFVKSKVAGQRLIKMLSLGSSVSWQEALKTLTGQNKLSARPLIEYYEPLFVWIMDYNKRHNIKAFL